MDGGFTEHSGCPVIEGEKKIVTQWVRLGVDDENPWNSFNTLGIKYSDAADQIANGTDRDHIGSGTADVERAKQVHSMTLT
eukprot:scaffold7726_cov267-Alexandrium_tamarense.AAC.1